MKVTSITVTNYYDSLSGNIGVQDKSAAIAITLSPEECHELMALGLRIFEQRQQAIASSIANMKPELLIAPSVPEAVVVEAPSFDDDIPF